MSLITFNIAMRAVVVQKVLKKTSQNYFTMEGNLKKFDEIQTNCV